MSKHPAFSIWDESDLYRNAVQDLTEASTVMKLDPNILERLKVPKRALVVSVPIRLDDGRVKTFEGYRVQHNMTLGQARAGYGFIPMYLVRDSRTCDAQHLNARFGLPLGGAKGGVRVDSRQLSRSEAQSLTRRYTTEINMIIGPDRDVPAPDVGTDAQHMAWIMDTYSQERGFSIPGVVTGKPIEIGGSLGRAESTGRGVVYSIQHAVRHLTDNGKSAPRLDNSTTCAVQGFGKVGAVAAHEIQQLGVKVVAVSDVSHAIHNRNGLNIDDVSKYIVKHGTLEGYPEGEAISNEDLLALPVDILIPAAIDGVVTKENCHKVNAHHRRRRKRTADDRSHERPRRAWSFILPDVLCKRRRRIVSYFEWSRFRIFSGAKRK